VESARCGESGGSSLCEAHALGQHETEAIEECDWAKSGCVTQRKRISPYVAVGSGTPDQMTCKRARLNAPALIEFAQLSYRLLNHASADADAAHQAPITVNLPVFLANRVAQVHAPSEPACSKRKDPRSSLHAQIRRANGPTL
jgi:hypothetical protein